MKGGIRTPCGKFLGTPLPLNQHQSGLTKRHSIENLSSFPCTITLCLHAISHQQVSCLYLLDISTAFDTIDHNINFASKAECLVRFYCSPLYISLITM